MMYDMMECDRCGLDEKVDKKVLQVAVEYLYHPNSMLPELKYLDLCYRCRKSFDDWMNFEGKHKWKRSKM